MYATESEAHSEWHWNSGIPMGTPGCPQDACHLPEPSCWDCFDETPESCPNCIAALAAAEAALAERASQPDPWAGTAWSRAWEAATCGIPGHVRIDGICQASPEMPF